MFRRFTSGVALGTFALAASVGAWAQGTQPAQPAQPAQPPAAAPQDKSAPAGEAKPGDAKPAEPQPAASKEMKFMPAPEPGMHSALMGKGVSGFFNVREAYTGLPQGGIDLELTYQWVTASHQHDQNNLFQTIRYGIDNETWVELTVSEPLNDIDQGAGELYLGLLHTFWMETELLPAFAGEARIRIPSGYHSSGVDGFFRGMLTKTIFTGVRVHFNGFVQTSAGQQGEAVEGVIRRSFQWGLGPGFDVQLWEGAIGVVNYVNRCNPTTVGPNQNVLELGLVQNLPNWSEHLTQNIKIAQDIGLDGNQQTPNYGIKFQYGLGIR